MDTLRILASLLVPWLLGVAILLSGLRRRGEAAGENAWVLGGGYLLGAFVLSLWMRGLSLVGVAFGIASVGAPLALTALILGALAWRRAGRPAVSTWRARGLALLRPQFASRTARALWWGLVAWLALRFLLLAYEVTLRPLFPWDAWIQWATKARVWFELGRVVPFGTASEWFGAPGSVYFDASPYYPPTVPLLQVWTSLMLGRWDDALMNWPWWQLLLALVLVVYGGLRSLGAGPLAALCGAALVGTLPLLDTHVALAGYADLPMAAYYTVAGLALLRWTRSRDARDAGLTVILALACTQVKNPGLPWALTLLPAVIVTLLPGRGLRVVGYIFGLGLLLLAILAQTNPVILHYRLHLDFDPAWPALLQSYFLLGNWHLLWYGFVAAALLARRELFTPTLVPLTVMVGAGVLFLFIVFGFTNARAWVADQTSINRATLHFAPLAVVFSVLAFHAFAMRWTANNAVPREAAAPPPPPSVEPSAHAEPS